MATINLTEDELRRMSTQMRKWSSALNGLNTSVRGLVQNMDGWKDSQYQIFLQSVVMTGEQIRQYCECMEGMSRSIAIYAEQQRKMQNDFNQQFNR